jgi:hypothetical protein
VSQLPSHRRRFQHLHVNAPTASRDQQGNNDAALNRGAPLSMPEYAFVL